MLSDEEKQQLEQEFQYALDNIVGKIKGETATAIVVSEQSMILLFTKLMLKIEKQSKEIEHWKAGMKIIEKDKNNHIERLERKIKELDSQNEVLEEIKTSYEKKTDKLLKEKVKKEKEIEELRNEVMEKELIIDGMKEDRRIAVEEIQEQYYVSKDKIKAKIEELEKQDRENRMSHNYLVIPVLQSLLEKE